MAVVFGNYSSLEWFIDRYRVKTNRQCDIVNDPCCSDDPQYIAQLIGKETSCSLAHCR